MSSSTLVPVYHYNGRLYASTSSVNHVRYILRLINVSTTVTHARRQDLAGGGVKKQGGAHF